MGISDRLKDLKTKATDAAAEHSDKLHEAVDRVATVADERTRGKYSERIQKVGAKADGMVESFKSPATSSEGERDAPASGEGQPNGESPAPGASADSEQDGPAQ